ncbi:hypothetical protein GE09DRAFT_1230285 [Coniochaeta sp. 2T2.1]|nr:hypothetical protein GE09DRAFT_1230285 [Coniochaeta sp. 2T2.1]
MRVGMEMILRVIGVDTLIPDIAIAITITITGDMTMRTAIGHRHDRDRRDHSPAPRSIDDRDGRTKTSSSGSRYSSTHHCIDSVLKQQQPLGIGAISPSPTPPSSQTTRLPPPGTEQHYISHRCHDASHIDSPIRSTTPHSSTTHHHRSRRRNPPRPSHHSPPKPVALPYAARALSRWDFAAFEPLLAHYLERHKRMNIADLDEESMRDRWKAFVAKWNAGEMEKAWYEPEMFLRVVRMRARAAEEEDSRVRVVTVGDARAGDAGVMTPPPTGASNASGMGESVVDSVMTGFNAGTVAESQTEDDDDDEEEEDEYAPPLPPASTSQPPQPPSSTATTAIPGPTIPSLQDLELRRTVESEARASSLAAHRLLRRADCAVQKSRLDDVLPSRAEPGTRERQLEKKRLVTESNREFAAAREAGGDVEVGEKELLGGGEAGEDEYKRMLERMRNRKSEREVRREEERRAKGVEREERIREARAREEEKLGVLREMARQRFG